MTIAPEKLSEGRVVAIAGPVIDVEFPPHALPENNYAVEVDLDLDGKQITVTAEVAQQIGDGDQLVRIAAGIRQRADRGRRGVDADRPVAVDEAGDLAQAAGGGVEG